MRMTMSMSRLSQPVLHLTNDFQINTHELGVVYSQPTTESQITFMRESGKSPLGRYSRRLLKGQLIDGRDYL